MIYETAAVNLKNITSDFIKILLLEKNAFSIKRKNKQNLQK